MAWIQLHEVLDKDGDWNPPPGWWSGETTLGVERGLLGAMILGGHPEEAEGHLSHADFLDRRHAMIYRAILAIRDGGAIPDLVLVTHELERTGNLGTAGGVVYVTSLIDKLPDIENVPVYARYVREAAKWRKLERKP